MHVLEPSCSVRCLEAELSRGTYHALVIGIPRTSATVGDVLGLYRQGRLGDIYNISTGRIGEIRRALTRAGLLSAPP
ncbi:MAG: hypothetical protein ACRDPO_25740, partial [Streptosporangiaceae bacterium]